VEVGVSAASALVAESLGDDPQPAEASTIAAVAQARTEHQSRIAAPYPG
jgi:hypothetical protein